MRRLLLALKHVPASKRDSNVFLPRPNSLLNFSCSNLVNSSEPSLPRVQVCNHCPKALQSLHVPTTAQCPCSTQRSSKQLSTDHRSANLLNTSSLNTQKSFGGPLSQRPSLHSIHLDSVRLPYTASTLHTYFSFIQTLYILIPTPRWHTDRRYSPASYC